MEYQYLSLEVLAGVLDLPQKYLKGLADKGKIPSLKAGRSVRFQVGDVREALRQLSLKGDDESGLVEQELPRPTIISTGGHGER